MIYLTKKTSDKKRFLFNHQTIREANTTPDGTLITTNEGTLIMVEESFEEIIKEVQNFEAGILLVLEKKKEEGSCS